MTVQGRNVPRAARARRPQAAFFHALAGPSMILNLSAWQAGACGVQDANHGLAGVLQVPRLSPILAAKHARHRRDPSAPPGFGHPG